MTLGKLAPPVFVEIGCGTRPVVTHGNLVFGPENQYLGFDIRQEALYGPMGAVAEAAKKKPDVNAEFFVGPGGTLPIPTGSANEAFLGDVLGDPSIDRQHLNRVRQQRAAAWIESGEGRSPAPITASDFIMLRGILKELHRVLHDDGKLTILETLSPISVELLTGLLRLSGFALEAEGYVTCRNKDRWQEAVEPYQTNPEDGMPYYPAFIAFSKKQRP
jgi:ubiquinone/menaquinone biosynthesis C-methylase UbiE